MSKQKKKSHFNLAFRFPEAALTDPKAFKREVRLFQKRLGELAKATSKGLHVERSARVGGGG